VFNPQGCRYEGSVPDRDFVCKNGEQCTTFMATASTVVFTNQRPFLSNTAIFWRVIVAKGSAMTTDIQAEPTEACFDLHLKCGQWAGACASLTIGKWVQLKCPKSCGLCSYGRAMGAALLSSQLGR
jgi:hypothetical protein